MITSFSGEYRWLSNFVSNPVWLFNVQYPTVEHAYQSAKAPHDEAWQRFCQFEESPYLIKSKGKARPRLPEQQAINIMRQLIDQKFSAEPYRTKLMETGDTPIEEGNHWYDTFWGTYNGKGQNHLGKLIMEKRKALFKESRRGGVYGDYTVKPLSPAEMLSRALAIMTKAFDGKMDKGGMPYALHCIAVADGVRERGASVMAAAVLHDLLEDTPWTADMLRAEGFSEEVISMVVACTRLAGEDYLESYIERVGSNPDTRAIKKADLTHNMRPERLYALTDKVLDRMVKYHHAYSRLGVLEALEKKGTGEGQCTK